MGQGTVSERKVAVSAFVSGKRQIKIRVPCVRLRCLLLCQLKVMITSKECEGEVSAFVSA